VEVVCDGSASLEGDGERDDSTERDNNDVAAVDLSVGRLKLNTEGRLVVDTEADEDSPARVPDPDASADRNLLRAPAAVPGADTGSGSGNRDRNEFLGGEDPVRLVGGKRRSTSAGNAEARSTDPLDEPDAVPGTDGPGESERALESSDMNPPLLSVPLLSL
jgi:hypothetical protein